MVTFFASISLAATYDFPEGDNLRLSIAGSFIKTPEDHRYEDIKIAPKKGSRRTKKMTVRYYPAQSDEVVIVLSGIGEYEKAKVANNLATKLVHSHKNVIVFPSIFTEAFAESFSKTGYVGFLPADAVDLYDAIEATLFEIGARNKRYFKEFSLMGYSLGALTAAHLAKYTHDKNTSILFKETVLISSPVNLLFGLRFLDTSAKKGGKPTLWNTLFGEFKPLRDISWHNRSIEQLEEEDFINYMEKLETVQENDLASLIGNLLKTSLSGVVIASQKAYDLDILPRTQRSAGAPDISEILRRRNSAARKITFEQYAKDILSRYYKNVLGRRGFDLQFMNEQSSLTSLEKFLRNSSHIYLIHNEDDFLLRSKQDVTYLRSVFNNRALFFPRGGHLGNLWHDGTITSLFCFLAEHTISYATPCFNSVNKL